MKDIIYNYFCLTQETLNLFQYRLTKPHQDFKFLYSNSDIYEKYLGKAQYEIGMFVENVRGLSIKNIENKLDSYRFFFSLVNTSMDPQLKNLIMISEIFIFITNLLKELLQLQDENSFPTDCTIKYILSQDLYHQMGVYIENIRDIITEENPNLELLLLE